MPSDDSSNKRVKNSRPIEIPGGLSTTHYARMRSEERHSTIRGELHDPSNLKTLSPPVLSNIRQAWVKRNQELTLQGTASGKKREEHASFAAGYATEVNESYRLALSQQHQITNYQQRLPTPLGGSVRPDLTLAATPPKQHFAEFKTGKKIDTRSERQLGQILQHGDVTLFTGASSADVDIETLQRVDAANTGPNQFLVGTNSMHEGMGVTVEALMERIRLRGKHPELFREFPTDPPDKKG